MTKSNTSIINHIPLFLNYCEKEGLTKNTQENYKHYLNCFILFLKKNGKESLLPHQFNDKEIINYKQYLDLAKDIVCIPPTKVTLLGGLKSGKRANFLNNKQLRDLLEAPNIKKPAGLRDRLILEILISSGLKVGQLTKLNKKDLSDIPKKSLPWAKKYLETRKDNNKELLVNYRSRKNASKRLTSRSIERIIKNYGEKINLPFFISPEALRWSYHSSLLGEELKEIKQVKTHNVLIMQKYNLRLDKKKGTHKKERQSLPSWQKVEYFIRKEMSWLKNNISVFPEPYTENPQFLSCDDCIIRRLAILIVADKITANEIRNIEDIDLWNNLTAETKFNKSSRHGKDWHRKMINAIYEYFKKEGYKIELEPILGYGRADLAIYHNTEKTIFIEVGTVSLYKLWFNFLTMKNCKFLIVTTEKSLLEFNT